MQILTFQFGGGSRGIVSPPASSKIGEPLPVADPGNYGMRPGHVVEAVTNAHNLLPPTVTSPSKEFQNPKSSAEEDDVRYATTPLVLAVWKRGCVYVKSCINGNFNI